nr:MAG TPA: hypothetical protein [Caudoviricetes sp.]
MPSISDFSEIEGIFRALRRKYSLRGLFSIKIM